MLLKILQSSWKIILAMAVFGSALSLGFTLAKEPLYTAESRVLIRYIQTAGIDAFTASRAAGKIGQTFSQVAHTELFLQKVMKTPYVSAVAFPSGSDPAARRRFWKDTVKVSVGIDSSIVNIKAYSQNPEDAKNIVEAVTYVYMTQGEEFHGADGLVSLIQVDTPAATRSPVRPQIVMSALSGLLLGMLFGFLAGCVRIAFSVGFAVVPSVVQQSAQRVAGRPVRREKEGIREKVSDAPKAEESSKLEQPRLLERVVEQRVEEPAVRQADRLGGRRDHVVRTIFDDLVRLGLDPNRLTVEA